MSEEIEKKVELAYLLDFYGGMLTEKQREVLSMHCEDDLSLSEIAAEESISRQSVHDMLTRTARKLFEMEEKLGIAARFSAIQQGLEDCREALARGDHDQAAGVLDQLIRLNQEESNGL